MKRIIIACSCILFLLFALLSKYEDRAGMRNLDLAATVKVQEKIDRSSRLRLKVVVDSTLEGSSHLASPLVSSIATVIIALFAYKKNKRWSIAICIAFAMIVIVEIYAKSAVHHPSPPFEYIKHTTSVFPANYINEQYSYPSGHAARAMFIALVLTALIKNKLILLSMIFYVGIVSVSRVYLGHHWFSDVLGGLLLGSAFGAGVVGFLYDRSHT